MKLPLLVLPLLTLPQATEPLEVEVFNGRDLTGWKSLGDARYTVDDGAILGEVAGGGQSFLVTERSFGDFVLEVDVKPELPGNSGIQVRSHLRENGRVFGYQIEIDSSERAWSGGLYDEARRGWLQNLEGRDEARAAFEPGEWNAYRIECRGPWIRTWINGVPITDYLDPLDMEGFIGLQVHSGNDTRVRWRGLKLVDHGQHAWRAAEGPVTSDPKGLCAVRWRLEPGGGPVLLQVGEPSASERRVAPGLHASATGWSVRVHDDPDIELKEEAREIAVIRMAERVRVFVDGKRVSAHDAPELPGGAVRLEGAALEVLRELAD